MKSNLFHYSNFFDTSDFPYHTIFAETQNVWEVLSQISEFIKSLFASGKVMPNFQDKSDVYVGEGTVIHEGAHIVGPVIIGRDCFIGHGSLLREYCLFGNNVRIGHAVEVKKSIFLNDATAAHLNYVGDSIIGNQVNISGGTILANYRLDKKSVVIRINDERVETGLEKFGSIIGDGSNIGVNSVLNPGTILGKNTIVHPLVSVIGFHKNNETVK